MCKFNQNFRSLFWKVLFLCTIAHHVFADDILWESGINLYIKLDKQDKSVSGKTTPNNHPVELSEKHIAESLELLELWSKDYYEDGNAENVFTVTQSRLLGEHIAKGLKKARPNQDIVFALVAMKKGGFGISEPKYMGGRAFYYDNKLNIIIGDYNKPRNKGMEAAVGGTGTVEIRYNIIVGKRRKASKFDMQLLKVDGIDYATANSKTRKDWVLLDLAKTKKTIASRKESKRRNTKEYKQDKLLKDEAAKLAKERREMRLEMARLRKEMDENKRGSDLSIEERLGKLQELRDKELISKEEYDKRRAEILNEI